MLRLSKSQAESSRGPSSRMRCAVRAHFPVSLTMGAALLAAVCLQPGTTLRAQTAPASQTTPNAAQSAPASSTPAARKHHASAHKPAQAQAKTTARAEPSPIPPAPKAPDWPANDAPAPATVVWDSHGLKVVASNSSLNRILHEISVDTGTKIEGYGQDERIFGSYGPAPASEVISQLLDGSNYDVAITGDRGGGTPERVVLTLRSGAAPPTPNASPNQPSDEDNGGDEQADEPEPPPQPVPPPLPPQSRPSPNDMPYQMRGKTQQQLIQEMQERQRQLQQQQQQQQQQQSPQQ